MLTDEAFATQAVYSVDARHPIEVDAAEREHLVHWLSNRLIRTLEAPVLRAAGFQLLGGRLLATERGSAAALFMYSDSAGQRVSVLVRPMAAGIHVPQSDAKSGRIAVCAWIGGGLGYAVAGALPDDQLDHISGLIRERGRAPS
jgi:anti-sigma factor RsiW